MVVQQSLINAIENEWIVVECKKTTQVDIVRVVMKSVVDSEIFWSFNTNLVTLIVGSVVKLQIIDTGKKVSRVNGV